MADLLQFVDQVSATPTVRLDLNDGVKWELQYEGTDFSPPQLRQAWSSTMLVDGEHLAASAFENRRIRLRLDLHEGTVDDAVTEIQKLHRELDRPVNVLKWQPEGVSAPVFFRTLRSVANRVTEWPGGGNLRSLDVEIVAKPAADGLKETLGPFTVYTDPATPGADLNANPYFEADASNWTALGGSVARSTTQFHEGAASLLLTPDGVSSTVQARAENVTIGQGREYLASAWARCAVSRSVNVAINWRDTGGSIVSTSTSAPIALTAGVWTYVELKATAPASAVSAQLIPLSMGGTPPAGHTCHVDEARLREVGAGNAMHVDLTGIKGDVETPPRIIVPQAGDLIITDRMSALAMRRRGNPTQMPFLLQAEAMIQGTDTSVQATAEDASGTGSKWSRTTFATVATAPVARLTVNTWPTTDNPDVRGRYRVFARLRTTNSSDVVHAQLRWGLNVTSAGTGEVSVGWDGAAGSTSWRLADLGLISFPAGADPGVDGLTGAPLNARGQKLWVEARRESGSGSLDWDYLLFVPADDRLAFIDWGDIDQLGGSVVVDAATETIYPVNASGVVYGGGLPPATTGWMMLSPGVTNRLFWLRSAHPMGPDSTVSSTDLTIEYQPRYLYARPPTT